MKFCPVCKTSYDEEILRFCTKDGTPLVEDKEPNFTQMPSRDDLGEDTVIRRKTPPPIPSTAQPVPDFDEPPQKISAPRIVIPMGEDDEDYSDNPNAQREAVRARTTPSPRRMPPPNQKSNTALVVFLTVLGTIVVLGGGVGIFWFVSKQNSNSNQNTNYNVTLNSQEVNLNSNVSNSLANFNYSVNSNSNANTNSNSNTNANANMKSPSPTPSRTPTPDANANVNINTNSLPNTNTTTTPNANVRPTPPRPSVTETPRSTPTPASGRPVNAGVLNGRAVNLPKPAYPPLAKQMRAEGQVAVQVLLDAAGNVTSAKATSGNPLLRAPAEAAAKQSKFNPVTVNNQSVPASGVVIYNFINQ